MLLKVTVGNKCPSLKNIILFDKVTEEQRQKAQALDIKVYEYEQVIELGKQNAQVVLTPPSPDTVYMFCYTSGTTGDPKGAKLAHSALMAI